MNGGNVKRTAIALASLLVVSTLAGSVSAARPGRAYGGQTSDGDTVRFRITRTDTGREIRFFYLRAVLDCDDATTEEVRVALSDWGWDFEGGTVSVDEDRPENWGLDIEGRFQPSSASGSLRYTEVLLTDDHTARLCTTGDVTWTAERLPT
jgi:hypothetical protein